MQRRRIHSPHFFFFFFFGVDNSHIPELKRTLGVVLRPDFRGAFLREALARAKLAILVAEDAQSDLGE